MSTYQGSGSGSIWILIICWIRIQVKNRTLILKKNIFNIRKNALFANFSHEKTK
jgi:hypothetical protein